MELSLRKELVYTSSLYLISVPAFRTVILPIFESFVSLSLVVQVTMYTSTSEDQCFLVYLLCVTYIGN